MSYFARIDKKTNEVLQVHSVDMKNCLDTEKQESELVAIEFLKKVHAKQEWINRVEFVQTSFNNTFREKFAALGDKFDKERNVFTNTNILDLDALRLRIQAMQDYLSQKKNNSYEKI